MEYSKKEILERMKKSHSWKEAQIGTPMEVYKALVDGGSDTTAGIGSNSNEEALQGRVRELEEQVRELQEQKSRLSDTNKQLRAENKALRAGK